MDAPPGCPKASGATNLGPLMRQVQRAVAVAGEVSESAAGAAVSGQPGAKGRFVFLGDGMGFS